MEKQQIQAWLINLPNKLTIGRILILPVIIMLYPIDFLPVRVVCALIFLAAALTDLLDGFLARKYNQLTPEGALLDPIADKMLMITGLILISSVGNLYAWIAILLVCRDVGITGLRLVALERQVTVEVSQYGKYKTTLQTAGIFCLMISEPILDIPFQTIGMLSIWGALGLSIYSGYLYWLEFVKKTNFLKKPN